MRDRPDPTSSPDRLGFAPIGYRPTHVYREPPMVGAAINLVYATWGGMPYSIQGPGDIALEQLLIQERVTWQFNANIVNGWPLATGTFVQAPLTYMPNFDNPLSHM